MEELERRRRTKAGVSNKPDVAGKRGACAVGAGVEAEKDEDKGADKERERR